MKNFHWFGLDTELCNANTNLWAVCFHLSSHPIKKKERIGLKVYSCVSHFTYLQACALTASQVGFGVALPYCSYMVRGPSPLNLNSHPAQRESVGVCALDTSQGGAQQSWDGAMDVWASLDEQLSIPLPWDIGLPHIEWEQCHLQTLLCNRISEWSSVFEVHFSYMLSWQWGNRLKISC